MTPHETAPELTYHHTALLVPDMEEAISQYAALFGTTAVSEVYHVTSQKVQVCLIKNGTETFLELVSPVSEDAPVMGLLRKKHAYYHLGYTVRHIHKTVQALEARGYKALEYYNSEAFEGRTCIFMFTPGGHLIELIDI